MKYVLALDQGTTSCRAMLFDRDGRARAVAQREFRQIFPQDGWVEHDANEIWQTQCQVAIEVLKNANAKAVDVATVGVTNQRETTVVWDRKTGEPIHNAIVWQDRRTAETCDRLRSAGVSETVRAKTGLVIDPYFSGTKIAWILDHVPDARRRALAGELAFGTIDTWLIWKLSDGTAHVTDPSNASRTLLFDIRKGTWDDELLRTFKVPAAVLPKVRPSSGVFAEISAVEALKGLQVAGVAGDQQAALFGQTCWENGQTKTTYGTGCFMLQCTGTKAVESKQRLLTTVAWQIGDKVEYALEGSVFVAGAVVQWLRDGLGLAATSQEIADLAASVTSSEGVYLVPAFAGLGAPHWDAYARGAVVGLTRATTKAHIARAAIDSIAFQTADLVAAMQADSGLALPEMQVDGGASRNDALMQFQADLLQVPLVRPAETETTALGAALLAGLAVGFWKDRAEIASRRTIDRRFEPGRATEVEALKRRWSRAVQRTKEWVKEDGA